MSEYYPTHDTPTESPYETGLNFDDFYNRREPLTSDEVETLATEVIGTRDEPKLIKGQQVVLPGEKVYVVEHIDHNGRGIMLAPQEDQLSLYGHEQMLDISFKAFFEKIFNIPAKQ
ncbi:MAG: hypothetical protein WD061_03460 [Candidatus Saccharimonadales bacterium]